MRRRELLSSAKANDGRGIYNNYEYVDLKLTGDAANLMFATRNVGATKETSYGNYYQWGAGSTKYADTNQYHTGGTSTAYTLPMSADTARQVMEGDWRMPTYKELQALIAQTDYQWTTINGVKGDKFTSKVNPKAYLFLPAAGYYFNGTLSDKGSYGYVWSSSPHKNSYGTLGAYTLCFNDDLLYFERKVRNCGFSIRGVFTHN